MRETTSVSAERPTRLRGGAPQLTPERDELRGAAGSTKAPFLISEIGAWTSSVFLSHWVRTQLSLPDGSHRERRDPRDKSLAWLRAARGSTARKTPCLLRGVADPALDHDVAGQPAQARDLAAQGQQEAQPGQDEAGHDQETSQRLQLAHVVILGRRASLHRPGLGRCAASRE